MAHVFQILGVQWEEYQEKLTFIKHFPREFARVIGLLFIWYFLRIVGLIV